MSMSVWIDSWLWSSRRSAPPAPDVRIVTIDKAAVRLRDSGGDLPALVFLCDPPVVVEHYDELISRLADRYRVIVVELPGFGFSTPASARDLEFIGTVKRVESALLSLRLNPSVVIGPCVCGFVATALVAGGRLPIQGLVLNQSPDFAEMMAWVDRMDPQGRLRRPLLGQFIVRFAARKLTKFWIRYATAKSTDDQPLTKIALQNLDDGGAYRLATMLQRWGDGPADLALEIPTLVVWGRDDRSHADTDHRCSLAHAPGAQLHELADCGHFPELEKPTEFIELLLPFLSDCLSR